MTFLDDQSVAMHSFLSYDDPLAPTVTLDGVVRRAQTVRRARFAVALCAVSVLIAGAAAVTVHLTDAADRSGPPERAMAPSFVQEHPAMGRIVTVDESVRGWIAIAWISTGREFCAGTTATDTRKTPMSTLNCWQSVDTGAPGGAGPAILELPIFQTLPTPADSHGQALAIGLTRGDIGSVQVVFRGVTVTAEVHRIDTGTAATFGAYAVWLPLNGATSFGSRDIAEISGRDVAGNVVAHLP